jgi:hypothetical protein
MLSGLSNERFALLHEPHCLEYLLIDYSCAACTPLRGLLLRGMAHLQKDEQNIIHPFHHIFMLFVDL